MLWAALFLHFREFAQIKKMQTAPKHAEFIAKQDKQ
jgi:hypothetical protein